MTAQPVELPRRIVTARLLLDAVRVEDAVEQTEALNASINQCRPWLPFAQETQTLAGAEENLLAAVVAFDAGLEFNWIIKETNGTFVGRVGLMRIDAAVPKGEIGYWLTTAQAGRGYMREAVSAVVSACEAVGFRRLEIRCDSLNTRSAHVAETLGFTLDGVLANNFRAPDDPTQLRDTLVFSRVW